MTSTPVARAAVGAGVLCLLAFGATGRGTSTGASSAPHVTEHQPLQTVAPSVFVRLRDQERAQGLLFEALAARRGRVAERAVRLRMTRLIAGGAPGGDENTTAVPGFDVLGPDAAALIHRAFAFHREVVAIHVQARPEDRRVALEAAVQRYQAGPGRAVADAPKDMAILYDHPYTSFVPPVPPEAEPHRELAYPSLTGSMWAARWYALAVLAPFEDYSPGPERDRALEIVDGRLRAKLALAEPADVLPAELPLAPAIAPGLVATHDRAASIIDNLHMMLDVLADVLVHPKVKNRKAAVQAVVDGFSTRRHRCVQVDEWIVVALRHSIFAQGGPALATMSARERNAFSGVHGQHYGPRRAPPPCDP